MSTTTSNLGLFKYDNSDYDEIFDFHLALNGNWDILDNLTNKETIQNIITLSNGTISLNPNSSIYQITPSSNTTFTFSTTNLTLSNNLSYTFELIVNLSTLYPLTFPNSVSWQDNTIPNLSSTGLYLFVFRTIDAGTIWLGNLQGRW